VPCPDNVKEALRLNIGSKNANWRSGLTIEQGYLAFTASQANGEHARKHLHVVIAEWKIGRKLLEDESVHHDDENKLNNDPNNLIIMTKSEHARHHAIKNRLGHKK
jgi:hypothetical protein